MAECPHKEIVAFVTSNEYGMFRRSGWHCAWCHTEFVPKETKTETAPQERSKGQ